MEYVVCQRYFLSIIKSSKQLLLKDVAFSVFPGKFMVTSGK